MNAGIHVITLGVSNLEDSFRFYKEGLGFPTSMTPDKGIVLFTTSGSNLFLYPYEKLAEDFGGDPNALKGRDSFFGFSLGHAARTKAEVDDILRKAKDAGGRLVKPAHDVFWGGYSGYFSALDGCLWEVAYSSEWKFSPEGSLLM